MPTVETEEWIKVPTHLHSHFFLKKFAGYFFVTRHFDFKVSSEKAFHNNVSRSVKLRKASEQMGGNNIRRMKKGLKNWGGCYCGSVGGC